MISVHIVEAKPSCGSMMSIQRARAKRYDLGSHVILSIVARHIGQLS